MERGPGGGASTGGAVIEVAERTSMKALAERARDAAVAMRTVTAEPASICLKASNAVILRGGSEAKASNAAIVSVLSEALASEGLPRDAVLTVPRTDHDAVNELMSMVGLIDLVIPRGGESLI